MTKQNNYIAVIPARGGSKRLPGKNLLQIAGKPLIVWTIEAAIESNIFDRVLVTTDSEEIAEVSRRAGAEVPFLRPPDLAADNATTIDVLTHIIDTLKLSDELPYSHLTLLQPTSPLRDSVSIKNSIKFLEENKADAVISICKTEHSPLWSNILPSNNSLENFIAEKIQKTPSQDLPSHYRLNGAIYICNIKRMMKEKTLFLPNNCFGFVMSRKNSIDIDDQVDFDLAEIYLKRSKASI